MKLYNRGDHNASRVGQCCVSHNLLVTKYLGSLHALKVYFGVNIFN